MDPETGAVYAMVSKPDFRPGLVAENWEELNTDEDSLLLNRATQGLYPPGSTFKVVTALEYMREHVELPAGLPLYEADPEGFCVGQMMVRPFATSHDSVGSLGYRISLPDGQELGFATDLGCYTEAVEEGLRGCRTVMLESNYDDGMILVSDYPYYLKRRIQSRSGHLSNSDCAAALPALAQNGTRNFVLGHLSQNNNLGLLAQQASEQALLQAGLERGDFTLQIANRSQLSQPVLL